MAKIATRTVTHGKVVDGKLVEVIFNEGEELKGLSAADITALGDAVRDGPARGAVDIKAAAEKAAAENAAAGNQ